MSQLLKKFALLTACAVLALCFATRPAHAQMVDMNGTGEHLLYGYWSTANYMNTWVAVHSPLGVRTSGETKNVVRVVVRDQMGDAAVDFKICLTPGDSWTAALSMAGLTVADAGRCDEDVAQPTGRSAGRSADSVIETPMMGVPVSLGADGGYLEAWLAPMGGLADDTIPCRLLAGSTTVLLPPCGDGQSADQNASGAVAGGNDPDVMPDNATHRNISGTAVLVSPMAGFSSSYTATALTGCDVTDAGTAADRTAAKNNATDGCWTVPDNGDLAADGIDDETVLADNGITIALNAQGKDLLTGRWMAISDENITAHTKVVLTLPVNHLNYKDAAGDIAATDPVSILVFDDQGNIALEGRDVMLDMNVNMCRFMPAHMDDDMDMDMDDDMDMDGGMPMLSCNGMMVGELTSMAGEFRIFNNTLLMQGDDVETAATETLAITKTGAEADDLGIQGAEQAEDVQEAPAPAKPAGGQVPAQDLEAIGLIFSYFMGTDGNQYDQGNPVQSIDIDVPGPIGYSATDDAGPVDGL